MYSSSVQLQGLTATQVLLSHVQPSWPWLRPHLLPDSHLGPGPDPAHRLLGPRCDPAPCGCGERSGSQACTACMQAEDTPGPLLHFIREELLMEALQTGLTLSMVPRGGGMLGTPFPQAKGLLSSGFPRADGSRAGDLPGTHLGRSSGGDTQGARGSSTGPAKLRRRGQGCRMQ